MKIRIALSLALLATFGFGQLLQVSVSPNPALPGSTITIGVNDAYSHSTGMWTPGNSNFVSEVRSGSPNGPMVKMFPTSFLPGMIPPCGQPARTQPWITHSTLPPGDYWFGIAYNFAQFGGGAYTTEWFCLTIDDPMNPRPTLSAQGIPTVGTTYLMALQAPAHPADTYIMAMSASTNVGIALSPSIHFALDADLIFDLSFPNPDPALFQNFQGSFDLNGDASAAFVIPNLPQLACIPLHCQALIIPTPGAGTMIEATNCHSFFLQ